MANLLKIKEIAKEKNITMKDLAASAGITTQALHKLARENSTKVDTLELIAKKLGVSIGVFFDNDVLYEKSEVDVEKIVESNNLLVKTVAKLTDQIFELTCDRKKDTADTA